MICSNKLGALGILVMDAMEAALGELSPSAAALLLTLHHRPGLTVTGLAAIAGITQPTAVRVLDGLVQHGWVERQPRTGRTTPVRLTETGERQAQAIQAARAAALDRLLTPLPEQDRARFEDLLDRILAGATTSRAFARITCRLCDHAACDGPLCPIGTRATALEQSAAHIEEDKPC